MTNQRSYSRIEVAEVADPLEHHKGEVLNERQSKALSSCSPSKSGGVAALKVLRLGATRIRGLLLFLPQSCCEGSPHRIETAAKPRLARANGYWRLPRAARRTESLLQKIPGMSRIPPRLRNALARKGSGVHHDVGTGRRQRIPWVTLKPQMAPYLRG